MMIKFQKHYVTNGTIKAKVSYFYTPASQMPLRDAQVSIYAKDYGRELNVIMGSLCVNNTETMTDYFEKSHVTLRPGHPLYDQVKLRAEQNMADNAARWNKKCVAN